MEDHGYRLVHVGLDDGAPRRLAVAFGLPFIILSGLAGFGVVDYRQVVFDAELIGKLPHQPVQFRVRMELRERDRDALLAAPYRHESVRILTPVNSLMLRSAALSEHKRF